MATGGRGLRKPVPEQARPYANASTKDTTTQLSAAGRTGIRWEADVRQADRCFNSGTRPRRDQPAICTILQPDICHPRCTNGTVIPAAFRPAAVYEMVENGQTVCACRSIFRTASTARTCDIMDHLRGDPTVPPEGAAAGYELL